MVRIGDYEFVAHPGYVGMRRVPMSLGNSVAMVGSQLVISLLYLSERKYVMAAIFAGFTLLQIVLRVFQSRPEHGIKPLIVWREGSLSIRSEKVGAVSEIAVIVNAEGKRFLVLAYFPGLSRKPHLIWWTKTKEDAERLRELIASAIPIADEVWPPPPALSSDQAG